MSDDKAAEDRREYRWNLMAAIILSLATLASAWCGFQASSWNSVYSPESRTANGARLESGRQSDIADRQLSSDLLIFTAWLQAEINGQTAVAHEVELRFRDHFRPAFEAWRAQPVTAGGHLPEGTPFERAEYVLPTQAAAEDAAARAAAALDIAGMVACSSNAEALAAYAPGKDAKGARASLEAHLDAADVAGAASSRYVLTSVLFASVLFLAGIAAKLSNLRLAHAVVAVAGLALVAALWLLITSPVAFSGI